MFWLYLFLSCVSLFVVGGVMLLAMVYTTPSASGFRVALVLGCPIACYWLGGVVTFLYCLGEAFKP